MGVPNNKNKAMANKKIVARGGFEPPTFDYEPNELPTALSRNTN